MHKSTVIFLLLFIIVGCSKTATENTICEKKIQQLPYSDDRIILEMQNTTAPKQTQALFFKNEKIGFVATVDGKILKTKDSGLTWNTTFDASVTGVSFPFTDIHFLFDGEIGFAVGGSSNCNTSDCIPIRAKIARTNDGGETWQLVFTERGNEISDLFVGGPGVFVLDRYSSIDNVTYTQIYRSEDDGLTWNKFGSPVAINAHKGAYHNASFYLFGEEKIRNDFNGAIMRGKSWNNDLDWTKMFSTKGVAQAAAFRDFEIFFNIGKTHIHHTDYTWETIEELVELPKLSTFLKVHSDNTHLSAFGSGNNSDSTLDHGGIQVSDRELSNWCSYELEFMQSFSAVSFYNHSLGYGIDINGRLVKIDVL